MLNVLKVTDHPKITNLSSFTHSHVFPNLYVCVFFNVAYCFVHTIKVTKVVLDCVDTQVENDTLAKTILLSAITPAASKSPNWFKTVYGPNYKPAE